jgi:hypothetical protein
VHVIGARWGEYAEFGFLSQGWMNMGRVWKSTSRLDIVEDYQRAICGSTCEEYNFSSGLSPACRVPIVQLVAHGILALSLALNLGITINLETSQPKEGLHMVKTTKTTKVATEKSKTATGLGCVGKRVRRSG